MTLPKLILACLLAFTVPVCAHGPATAPATRPAAQSGLPAAPAAYMNDYAGVVPKATAQRINTTLKQFEGDTTNQIVVAIYQKMDSKEPIEQYTRKLANAWGVGERDRDNGVVLFVFVTDRQLYLQVGSGLEVRLASAAAKQIIDTQITPEFKKGDYGAGIEAGVKAIIDIVSGQ